MEKAKETVLPKSHVRVAGMPFRIALLPSSGSDPLNFSRWSTWRESQPVMPLHIEREHQRYSEEPRRAWERPASVDIWPEDSPATPPSPPLLKTLHKGQRYRWLAKWLGSRDCSVFKFECLLFLGDRKLTLPVLQLGGVGYNYQYARYCKENLNYIARVTLLTAKETKLSVIFYSAFWLLNNSAWKTAWPWDTSGITVAKVHRPPAGAAALNLRVMAPCLLLLVCFNL